MLTSDTAVELAGDRIAARSTTSGLSVKAGPLNARESLRHTLRRAMSMHKVNNPSQLHPATPLGVEMASLVTFAANGFASEPSGTKVQPVHALTLVFAEGTRVKIPDGDAPLRFFRWGGIGAITSGALMAAIFYWDLDAPFVPWVVVPLAVAVVVFAACEWARSWAKRRKEQTHGRVPEARRVITRMVDVTDTATNLHAAEQSLASRRQLREVVQGMCSLFSEQIGYKPVVFDGRRFSYPEIEFDGSPMIAEVNRALGRAMDELETPLPGALP